VHISDPLSLVNGNFDLFSKFLSSTPFGVTAFGSPAGKRDAESSKGPNTDKRNFQKSENCWGELIGKVAGQKSSITPEARKYQPSQLTAGKMRTGKFCGSSRSLFLGSRSFHRC